MSLKVRKDLAVSRGSIDPGKVITPPPKIQTTFNTGNANPAQPENRSRYTAEELGCGVNGANVYYLA
ncbi:MAG: hypothetical protein LBK53_08670 [Heliobacteriaceae bacterium]|jgi:hypothetical protein|nr:hypothetical protein [Heliobacteriaceae bacterium]